MLNFVKLDWSVCYQHLCKPDFLPRNFEFPEIKHQILPNQSKTIVTGKLNALSCDKLNSSSILKLNDTRLKRFTKVKEQILDWVGSVDFALKIDFWDYSYYDKQHKTFVSFDYVFMNFETE